MPVTVRTRSEDRFKLTPELLESAITPRTKMLVLAYPNNPTGAIMDADDLEKIAGILRERQIIVLSDEIYAELTYGRRHVSIASLPGMRERTVLASGFSKAGLPLRTGAARPADAQDTPVCHHVRADHLPACRRGGAPQRRRGHRFHDRGV